MDQIGTFLPAIGAAAKAGHVATRIKDVSL
jgi:hypothetical protein